MTANRLLTFLLIFFNLGVAHVYAQTYTPDGTSPVSVNRSGANAEFAYNVVEPASGFAESISFTNNTTNGTGTYADYSVAIDATKKKVEFALNSQLQYNTTYEITFTIAPESGGADETYTFSFDTGPKSSVNNATTDICADVLNYYPLDKIVISEGIADNFNSSDGRTHSLMLKLDDGLFFNTSVGGVSNTSTSSDVTNLSLTYVDAQKLKIEYDLCSGNGCTENVDYLDEITISNLEVKVSSLTLNIGSPFYIKRTAGTGEANDAVMPGLEAGTDPIFATINVGAANSMALEDENGNVLDNANEIMICYEESVQLKAVPTGGVQSGDLFTFYNGSTVLQSASTDSLITVDSVMAKNTGSEWPLDNFYATLTRAASCPAYTDEFIIDDYDEQVLDSITVGGILNGHSYSPVKSYNSVDVDPLNGVLTIRKNGVDSIVMEGYTNNFDFSTADFADDKEETEIVINYVAQTAGCDVGTTSLTFTILPEPKIEQDLGIFPSYCEDDTNVISIDFAPYDITDSTLIESFKIYGKGISGSTSASYEPASGSNSTGYAFDVASARAEATGDTINIAVSYRSSVSTPIYVEDCYTETYTETVCTPIYQCVFTGCLRCSPPLSTEASETTTERLVQIEDCNNCTDPGYECQYQGEDCQTVIRTRTVCDRVIDHYDTITSEIKLYYPVQFLTIPELGFTNVLRESVDTVICENADPVLLLGSPGNTFANKSFYLRNVESGNVSSLSEFSFTPGVDAVPNNDGYQLIFDFAGDISNCPNTDTLDFRIVPVPEAIQFDSSLALVDSIPTFSYCIGDAMDSVRLDSLAETKIVWRDDRGIALDTGYSFLPPLSTDQAKLQRFTAERYHIYGGCAGPASDFYIQVGNQPEAAYDFATTCGNAAGFKALASHNGTAARNDTINNYVWDFGDGSSALNTNEDSVGYTFANTGVYDVSMYVETSLGCIDSISKKVSVFDQVSVGNEYHESFDNGSGGWIATSENDNDNGNAQNSSWTITNVLGQPAWATRNDSTGRFNNDEYSWVESPCFDMNQWQNPMIEMDVYYNVQSIEGAVLQYRVNDPMVADPQWKLLGDLDRGVNWYNNASITASPGGSIIGWSGQSDTTDWTRAAFNLSKVKSEANGNMVQFRVAFASLDQTSRLSNYEGFAFDNVTIREKDRNVVVEHFTNVTIPSLKAERDSVSEFAMSRNDIVYIQYHTEEGDDPFYYNDYFPKNTSNDHLARRYFYGLDGPGYSVVNGQLLDTADFNTGWVQQSYSSQSLSYAPFDINIDFTKQSDGQLSVQAEALRNAAPNALLDNWPGDLTLSLTVAIVQKEVNYEGETLHNVLVKYLPFQGGVVHSGTWAAGSGASLNLEDTWQVLKDAPANEYAAIAMVQLVHGVEENQYGYPMNEVYQAAEETIDIPLTKSAVTGFEDNLGEDIRVYPNPVNDQLHINMGANREAVNWTFYNLQGEKVAQGEIAAGNRQAIISTALFRPGMYLLVLHNDNSQYQQRVTIMR